MLEMLISSVVLTLKLLIKLYNSDEIDYSTFRKNIELKLTFLKTNINNIISIEDRADAKNVINECEFILMHNPQIIDKIK